MDMNEVNRRTIEQFRAGGAIQGMNRERLLLLTTLGRRSGQRRTTPMMFHSDGTHVYVIASNIGAPKHPDWYLNLAADPRVTVEIGADTYDATATPLAGAERERVWTDIKTTYSFFNDHEAKTDRVIPVVELTRAD
jgi:deazaflavin-dependent oxidoreductase (nitroreductase family)